MTQLLSKVNIRFILTTLLLFTNLILFADPQSTDSSAYKDDALASIVYQMDDWTYKNVDSSRHYACILLNEALLQNDSFYIASAYTGLGYSFFYQHRLKEALNFLQVSHNIFQKQGDSLSLADTYMNLGNVYTEMGLYEKGIDYYKQAEKHISKNSKWMHYDLAYLYYNTAETFFDLEDFENTQEYLDKSESHAIIDSAHELLFAIKNMKAELLLADGHEEEARKYTQLALHQSIEYGDLLEQAKSLELLAKIQSNHDNHTKAISLQNEALEKAIQFRDPVTISQQYAHLSTVLIKAKQNELALKNAREAMKYAEITKSKILFKETAKALAQALEVNDLPREALEAYKLYYAYNDTLAKVNINERLLLTQNKIQTQRAQLFQAKNSFQQQIIKQDKIVMMGIGTAFLLTLILLLVLLKSLGRKRHSQKIIEEKQKLLNLKSEELNKTNQALKQLNEGKDKLFSILTHDLKQPFNQTLQLLEILDAEIKEDEDLRELTKQVKNTVEDTKGTVDNLLNWSKSQFTNLKTEPQAIQLKPLTSELQTEFKTLLNQKGLTSKISIDPDLKVLVDPNHLEIILRNLIQNAIKFSNSGGVIEMHAEKAKDRILLEVRDQGKGMDKNQLKNLFDVNTHFSTPGTLNEKGTGLGILIVKDFVRENNGKLEVESKPNQGSTFRIILPAA